MSGEVLENVSYCDNPMGVNMADSPEYEEQNEEEIEENRELPYIEETPPTLSESDSNELDTLFVDGWISLWGDEELKKRIVARGVKDTKPKHGFVCTVNLVGCLKNGTTFDEFEPMVVQIGDAEVVIGLDLVLASMEVREKALVEVSPDLGYGNMGRDPDVPPNEVLIYLVELLAAEPEPPLSSYTASELKLIGERKRERGNWWYNRNELVIALGCYKRALDYLGYEDRTLKKRALDDYTRAVDYNGPEDGTLGNSSPGEDLTEDRLKVYNNIAAIHLKMEDYDVALDAIDYVVACQPNNVKALFRKGKILAAIGQHASALEVLALANKLEPDNTEVRREASTILQVIKTESRQTNQLYKKMFGNDEKETPVCTETVKNETDSTETIAREKINVDTVKPEPIINETVNEVVHTETVNKDTVNEDVHTETVNKDTENVVVHTETVNKDTVNEVVHTETVNKETVDPQSSKAKRKNVLHLLKKKPKPRSKLGLIVACTVVPVAVGVIAYRYRNNLL